VLTRLNSYLSDLELVSHPADCYGDIGAATGGMLIAHAVKAFERNYNIAEEALLWASSDDGLRTALCIEKFNN
jgi:3-oxoacyl-[acyl-carrier-protein] synthase-1